MNFSTNVVLKAIKDPSRQVELGYSAAPTTATQRRVAGRTVVHPVIDLGDYPCAARLSQPSDGILTFDLGGKNLPNRIVRSVVILPRFYGMNRSNARHRRPSQLG
jgi:hypothetical protein